MVPVALKAPVRPDSLQAADVDAAVDIPIANVHAISSANIPKNSFTLPTKLGWSC